MKIAASNPIERHKQGRVGFPDRAEQGRDQKDRQERRQLDEHAGEAARRAAMLTFHAVREELVARIRRAGPTRRAARAHENTWPVSPTCPDASPCAVGPFPFSRGDGVVFIAGFDRRLGRIVAHELIGPDFEPFAVRMATLPWSDELLGLHPNELDDVIGLAIQQIVDLRANYPAASGGVLVGATVTAAGITVRPIAYLRTGRLLRRRPPVAIEPAQPAEMTTPLRLMLTFGLGIAVGCFAAVEACARVEFPLPGATVRQQVTLERVLRAAGVSRLTSPPSGGGFATSHPPRLVGFAA